MKSLLKNSRSKRKSVSEKSSSSSKTSTGTSKTTSRSGSRLGSNRALFESRNRSAESDINDVATISGTPSFARNPPTGQHPYGLKAKSQRESKASSALIETSRRSLESQMYDNISEYSSVPPGIPHQQDHDNHSIITNEEPINKQYTTSTSPKPEHGSAGSNDDTINRLTSSLAKASIDKKDNIPTSDNGGELLTAPQAPPSFNSNGKLSPSSSGSLGSSQGEGKKYYHSKPLSPTHSSNFSSSRQNDGPKTIQENESRSSPLHQQSQPSEHEPIEGQDEQTVEKNNQDVNEEEEKTQEEESQRAQEESKDMASFVSKATSTTINVGSSSSLPIFSKVNSNNYDFSVFKSGWLNRGTNMTSWSSSVTNDTWKLYRAEIKGASLFLYKPPNDLSIKHFDPKLKESDTSSNLSPTTTLTDTRSTSLERSQEKSNGIHSNNISNPPTLSNGVRQPGGFTSKPNISYISEVFPHPEVQTDDSGAVINGSLEAVCHTVLFNTSDDNRLSSQLISVIPMFGDTKIAIGYFIQYAFIFMSSQTLTEFKAKANSFRFPLPPSVTNRKNILISQTTDDIITNRLGFVVSIIQEQFPGMLMDSVIFDNILRLLELIGVHNDILAKELNKKIIGQQKSMTELLVFDASSTSKAITKDESFISAEDFLKVDLDEFSDQVNLIDLKFNEKWNPKSDASLLYETGYTYSRYNPLIFDPVSNVHYLGRLLVQHLFEDEQSKVSVQFRAKIIQKWVSLGSILDKKGDMVSWLAIATVICSIPILRLKKTWSVVDSKTLKVVSNEWGQVVFELDRRDMTSDAAHRSSYHVIAPQGIGETYSKYRVVPYFGDLAVKLRMPNITLKQCEKRVHRVKISFNRWDEYLSMVKEQTDFGELQKPIPKMQRLLYNLFSIHVSLDILTQEDIMKSSLSVEPSTSSSLFQFYSSYDHDRPPISAGTYYPTLFTDLLPNYRLFDKESLIQAGNNNQNIKRIGSVSKGQSITGVNIIDYPTIYQHSKYEGTGPLSNSIRDMVNINCDLFHVGDDLIFKAIFNNHNLENDDRSHNKPITVNVVPKASSFEKLIDILVLTPNIFSGHINEEDKDKYLTKHNAVGKTIKLDMDIGIYSETFFASYKSFCNLSTLIEGLGRRFVGAKGAAISIKKMKDHRDAGSTLSTASFPDWDTVVDSSDPEINWKYVAQIEAGILEALYILITEFYNDFTDEIQTKQSFIDILKIVDQEITNEWKNILKLHSNGKDELSKICDNLEKLYKKIRKDYIKRSYKPLDFSSTPHTFSSVVDFPPEHASLPASSSFAEIQQLIEKLDVVIYDLFKQATINDWLVVSDLFEMQSTRSLTSIFNYRQPSPAISEEDLKIFNIFQWLETLYVGKQDVKLLSKFPSNIRALYGLHGKITSYFLNQIIYPKMTVNKRRNKMTTILQMLAIIRCRMDSCRVFPGNMNTRIPAFLESCIAMAVCSPESRWFANDWIYSSFKLKNKEDEMKWDTLNDLIPKFDPKILLKEARSPLTPCFGWLCERLLEVGCFIPNVSVENSTLLNFDKCRYVYKLLSHSMQIKKDDHLYSKEEVQDIKKKFEFLYNIKRSIYDLRDIREVAKKDNKEYPRNEQKNKLFQNLVEVEFNKLKRDVAKKESLETQETKRKLSVASINSNVPINNTKNNTLKIEPQISAVSKPSSSISSSTSTNSFHQTASNNSSQTSSSSSSTSSSNQQTAKGGRFRIGGFLKSVRPFSINVSSSWSAPERVVSICELPDYNSVDTKNSKPSLQFKLMLMKPLIIHSSDIEGFFKLVDNEGQEYCFQATSTEEAHDWVRIISETKRLIYLSHEVRERNGNKVFGVPIQFVCERENNSIPHVVEKLLEEIERRGLDEVGLYRVPGAVANIQLLKQKFDENAEEVSLEDQRFIEINTLAGCFKLYLRELPESLLTTKLLPSFITVASNNDKESIPENVIELIKQLPYHNYHLLKKLVNHLNLVTEHSDKNRMDAANLAMVFSMSFLNSSESDFTRSLGGLQSILLMMIQDPKKYFMNEEYNHST